MTPTRRRARAPLWTRVLILSGALLMVLSGGLIIAERVAIHTATDSFNRVQVGAFGEDDQGHRRQSTIQGAKNILLVGIDPRNLDQLDVNGVRSDSIIMLHVTAAHDQAYLVSIPRDTLARIPAYDNGRQHSGEASDKINAAFARGAYGLTGTDALGHGLDLLARTIKLNWGVTFAAGAIVDFGGFQEVVHFIGGVDMYVDERVTSIHIGTDRNGKPVTPAYRLVGNTPVPIPGVTPVRYERGMHHFDAWAALDYCRQRDLLENGDSDYGRQRHQQQFLKAVFKKIVAQYLGSPTKLPGVLQQVGKAMTISDGGIPLEEWVFAMRGISTSGLVTIKTNGGRFNSTPDNKYELISPDSQALFRSVVDDTMDTFVATHLDWVATG